MQTLHDKVLDVLFELSRDIRELDVGESVERVSQLSAVEFLRDYVGPNKPVVITDAIHHWPAHKLWTDEYLIEKAGDTEVTVALTPNGRADAVTSLGSLPAGQLLACPTHQPGSTLQASRQPGECFALPAQRRMKLRDFISLFHASKGTAAAPGVGGEGPAQHGQQHAYASRRGCKLSQQQNSGQQQQEEQQEEEQEEQMVWGDITSEAAQQAGRRAGQQAEHLGEGLVPYLQFQNSSLLAELPQLLEDVDEHIPWATEALGCLPEAVNFWLGDERSVTSFHKDHFENLYGVVAGSKTFVLLPPSDVFRMRLQRYPLATYAPPAGTPAMESSSSGSSSSSSGRLVPVLQDPPQQVLWSAVQPEECWQQGQQWRGRGKRHDQQQQEQQQEEEQHDRWSEQQQQARLLEQQQQKQGPCLGLATEQQPGNQGGRQGGLQAEQVHAEPCGSRPSVAHAPACSSSDGCELTGQLAGSVHYGQQEGSTPSLAACRQSACCRCCAGRPRQAAAQQQHAAAAGPLDKLGTAPDGPGPAAEEAPTSAAANSCREGLLLSRDLFSNPSLPRPIRVTVGPGELLYLPAIWWHQVEQQADETGRGIAVNYWYDMKFDHKYAHYKAVESLAAALGLIQEPL